MPDDTVDYSNLFEGRIPAPSTFQELAGVLPQFCGDADSQSSNRVWRGQPRQWPVESTAVRRVSGSAFQDRVDDDMSDLLKTYERWLSQRARERGFGERNGRRLNTIELYSRLQHHGAATRLLDFTESMFAALWFASKDEPDKTGIVVGMYAGNEIGQVTHPDANLDSWHHRIDGLAEEERPSMLIRPPHTSPRIPAQRGVFMVFPHYDNPWGSIPQEELERGAVVMLLVTPELKASMQKYWATYFGMSQSRMFPDVDGFGDEHGAGASLKLHKGLHEFWMDYDKGLKQVHASINNGLFDG